VSEPWWWKATWSRVVPLRSSSGPCSLPWVLPPGGAVGLPPRGQPGGLHGEAGARSLAPEAEESLLLRDRRAAQRGQEVLPHEGEGPRGPGIRSEVCEANAKKRKMSFVCVEGVRVKRCPLVVNGPHYAVPVADRRLFTSFLGDSLFPHGLKVVRKQFKIYWRHFLKLVK